MALQDQANNYFKDLNPIASRIYMDLQETKQSYEKLWDTLDFEEQQEILNQAIIRPEIALKYCSHKTKDDDKQPILYGAKIISDDNYSYHDEHSAPFSYLTGSQRDLHLFGSNNITKKSPKILSPAKIIIVPQEKQQEVIEVKEYFPEVVSNTYDDDELDSSTGTSLPKTGLDLLDNW